ncbi:hypothetical protein CRENBAI_020924 [Crenichthys baileyi]|uniref:Uncharacterized protein n=1 Tax=Crenichthys baileyi TaxID=28760 RepID=A0AAV9RX13_9TELE
MNLEVSRHATLLQTEHLASLSAPPPKQNHTPNRTTTPALIDLRDPTLPCPDPNQTACSSSRPLTPDGQQRMGRDSVRCTNAATPPRHPPNHCTNTLPRCNSEHSSTQRSPPNHLANASSPSAPIH